MRDIAIRARGDKGRSQNRKKAVLPYHYMSLSVFRLRRSIASRTGIMAKIGAFLRSKEGVKRTICNDLGSLRLVCHRCIVDCRQAIRQPAAVFYIEHTE